jgi:hypothetical protein
MLNRIRPSVSSSNRWIGETVNIRAYRLSNYRCIKNRKLFDPELDFINFSLFLRKV